MLLDVRRIDVPALAAGHDLVDLRTPHLRLARIRSRNLVTDFGLLARTMPQLHDSRRSGLTLVFEGEGRFEERGERQFFGPGELVLNDHRRGGTEAYAGASCSYLAIEWDCEVYGAAHGQRFAIDRFSPRDVTRIRDAANALDGPRPSDAVASIVAVLRAAGLAIDGLDARALDAAARPALVPLQRAISRRLSLLHDFPTIEDLGDELGWNPRRIHRGIAVLASMYRFPWSHWREAVHQARLLHATRLLGAPGATTEGVARLSGFRAPAALCHAFAKAGLASPGKLSQTARRGALARWADFVDEARPD